MMGIFCVMIIVLMIIGEKFIPLLFHRTVYMCKHVVESVSFQEIPHYITSLIACSGILYIGYVVIEISIALFQYNILRRQLDKTGREPDARIISIQLKHPYLKDIHLMTHTKAQAFSLGFFHRHIYVSSELLQSVNNKELEAILLHEYTHVKNFDALKLLIAFLVETSLSFIPSLKDCTLHIRIDREIHADTFAVTTQKTNKYILGSIKKMLARTAINAIQPQFVPHFAVEDLFDARISSLIQQKTVYKKPFSKVRFFISVSSLSFIAFLMVTPLHATEMLVDGKSTVMACSESSPSCIALCQANASHLLKSQAPSQ